MAKMINCYSVIGNAFLCINKSYLTKDEIYKFWNIVDKLLPDGYYTSEEINAFENFCEEYSFLIKHNSNSAYVIDENKKNLDRYFRIGLPKEIFNVYSEAAKMVMNNIDIKYVDKEYQKNSSKKMS